MIVWEETVTSVKSCLTPFFLLPPYVGGSWDIVVSLAETICNINRLEISLLKRMCLWNIYMDEDFPTSAI